MKEKTKLLTREEIQHELASVKYRQRYLRVLFNTIFVLVTVSAVAILLSTLFFPVLRIYGGSMTPTYKNDDLVLCFKSNDYECGDVVAFYYNNQLLVKRVIASEGEWVDIDQDGNVYVNDSLIDEEYLVEKALGECDIEMPYQVPSESYFVMGDHRSTSMDSRLEQIGPANSEQIVGRILCKIWPLK